ncbi:MAG: CYTH domain-containing protein [Clostridiales bacterium]|nr:CYTH domain-containing protein [Clostridiales bacterium]
MAREIERKFLVSDWSDIFKYDFDTYDIQQSYINKHVRVRILVRKNAKSIMKAVMTVKFDKEGIERQEFEFPIPIEDAQEIMSKFRKYYIDKTRYVFEYKGKTWEVDDFHGDNHGLHIAEVELESENEEIEIPLGVGEEVTGDFRYYNSYISCHPYKHWGNVIENQHK